MYENKFSGKAEDYNKYRPKYPEELKEILFNELQLTSDKIVADIGSGTGISSEIFLDNKNLVFAVEPNAEMRKMAETSFEFEENFVSVPGTAENTGLNDNSIDFIFVGTAFHWFNLEKAKKEFGRILKKNGHIVIAWNNRDLENEFQRKLEDIFDTYLPTIKNVEEKKEGFGLKEFFAPKTFRHKVLNYEQIFGKEDFFGRLRSSSYYPDETSEIKAKLDEENALLFDEYETEGKIIFKYKTHIYWN